MPEPAVTSDPLDMLHHYAMGRVPVFAGEGRPLVWRACSHRGVQPLDRIRISRSQRRYVFAKDIEVRYDTAFNDVVRCCADPLRDPWINNTLIEGYLGLHRIGFAHSFESWRDGQLIGGGFGIQIGGVFTIESLFRRADNGAKPAYGQLLFRLRDRGFALADVVEVANHCVNYGEQYIPQWRFEQILRRHLSDRPSLLEGLTAPGFPLRLRLRNTVERLASKILLKLPARSRAAACNIVQAP